MGWQGRKVKCTPLKEEEKAKNLGALALREVSQYHRWNGKWPWHIPSTMLSVWNSVLDARKYYITMSQLVIADKHYLNEDLIRISFQQNELGTTDRDYVPSKDTVVWMFTWDSFPWLMSEAVVSLGFLVSDPVSLPWQMSKNTFSSNLDLVFQGQSLSISDPIRWPVFFSPQNHLMASCNNNNNTTIILNEIWKSKGEEKHVNWDLLKKFLHMTQLVSSSTELFPSDHTVWPNRSNFYNPHFAAERTQILRTSSSARYPKDPESDLKPLCLSPPPWRGQNFGVAVWFPFFLSFPVWTCSKQVTLGFISFHYKLKGLNCRVSRNILSSGW